MLMEAGVATAHTLRSCWACVLLVATLAPNARAFLKNGKWAPKWKRYHPRNVRPLARSMPTTYIFFIFQNLEEIDSCTRESTTGTTSLL